jgi:RNA-splicing ligase RtcB
MEWVKKEKNYRVPIKSWCRDVETGALNQAEDLARHPAMFRHVALMPDCHVGYGMPIGGVIAGQVGIIPGSMGTSSYIVEGLGNPESFMSCSHGAGRAMGRKAASRALTP